MATAAVKFTQNAVPGTAGVAYLGALALPVTIENGNNADVQAWKYELIDVPAASAVPRGTLSEGPSATASFTPDVRGCYLARVTVTDVNGRKVKSFPLAFGILETNGRLIPPFGAIDKSLNFGGQTRGYAKYIEEWLGMLSGGLPNPVNIAGAVIVEDPANTRIARRLRAQDIDPDFNIASFSTSPGTLVRRGDTLSGITASASYVSGPPTSGSIVDSYGNGASSPSGVWTFNSPFAAGSRSGTVIGAGVDGNPDPFWTATLTVNASGYPPRVTPYTTFFASDVYWGSTAAADIAGTDVYNAGLVGSFQSALQRVRQQSGRSFSGASRYDWLLWPNEATYTSGFNPASSARDQNNDIFLLTDMGTVSILRNGVTRTYRKLRSAGQLSSAFVVQVL